MKNPDALGLEARGRGGLGAEAIGLGHDPAYGPLHREPLGPTCPMASPLSR
jgi:hypothetical protein